MFEWDKECDRLEVSPERVRRLFCSLGDSQVALPGLPSQKSSAYLCVYEGSKGVQVVVVFHLLKSRRLAVYRNSQGEVAAQKLTALLDEGTHFAESLGFRLDDMEFHLLDPVAQRERWDALPLTHGGKDRQNEPAPAGASPSAVAVPSPIFEDLHERRRVFIEKHGRFLATL